MTYIHTHICVCVRDMQAKYNSWPHLLHHPIDMDNNPSQQILIDNHSHASNDDDDDLMDDDGADESHLLYMFNMVLNGTARLNVLLPTAIILAFSICAPILTSDGKCSNQNRWLTAAFLALMAASCVFFTFTDSFRNRAKGRLYYGVATFSGMWTFNGGRRRPRDPSSYRLRWGDLFHASLSLVAFLTFVASNTNVVECYHPSLPRKVTNVAPLAVGFVISVLFVVFPSKRRGIGYPFLLRRDPVHYRT